MYISISRFFNGHFCLLTGKYLIETAAAAAETVLDVVESITIHEA